MRNALMIATVCWRRGRGMLALSVILLAGLLLSVRVIAKPAPFVPTGPGSISGRVTDEVGVGLAGIEVALERIAPTVSTPHRLAASDANGAYTFGALSIGVYRVKFADPADHYGTLYAGGDSTPSNALTITINGNVVPDVNVALPLAGTISGTIRSDTSTILHDLFVMKQANDGTFQTVKTLLYENLLQGAIPYTVRGLAPGRYQLCTFVDPFPIEVNRCYGSSFGDHSPTTVNIDAGTQLTNVHIVLDDYRAGTALAGVAKDEAGQLLPGIRVTLWTQINDTWTEQSRSFTDHVGRYYFGNRPPGIYTMAFHDLTGKYITEYYGDVAVRPDAATITLALNQRRTDLVTTMNLASQIHGTIFIQEGIPPLYADLTLYIENGDTWTIFSYARSDAKSGAFHFTGLRAGRYRLKLVSDLGYGQITRYYGGDTLDNAQDISLGTAEIRQNLTILLGANEYNGTISGVVRDGTNPLAGIAVQILAGGYEYFAIADVVTDATGRYQFNNLLSGKYTLRFTDPQGMFATSYYGDQRVWPAAQRITLTPAQTITDADMTLVHGGAISGVIRDGWGRPLPNAAVRFAWRENGSWVLDTLSVVPTNAQGVYVLRGLRPDTYRIAAMHPAFGPLYWEYYGTGPLFEQATDLVVGSDRNHTGIDIRLGPDYPSWLPLIVQ